MKTRLSGSLILKTGNYKGLFLSGKSLLDLCTRFPSDQFDIEPSPVHYQVILTLIGNIFLAASPAQIWQCA
ncbi:MAG: hypothetical protein OEY09_13050, partial [Gammaproteobacteria bacterium]|nr:hypothetical protein [Gammaproteobacteria bacterium]